MNQHDLNREIAIATGESTATIEALGFSLLAIPSTPFDHRRHFRQQQRGKGPSRTPSRPKKRTQRIGRPILPAPPDKDSTIHPVAPPLG